MAQYREGTPNTNLGKIVGLVGVGLVGLFILFSIGRIIENVAASEIVVVQYPTGGLKFVSTQGPTFQALGSVTTYPKRNQYEFETQVRFNDGGHGTMKGSVQWEMPQDEQNLLSLHTRFGSAESIQAQLIEKVVNKAVYMTGPLMSSKESYAEKRNYLINYVEDQITNGVYRTVQREARVVDQLTGQEKTAVVVDIVMQNNVPVRQEEAVLSEFGIRTFNFAINSLIYDEQVEKQIQQQQQITMDVQTAIAEARKAEQRKITTEQQGQASAAAAKWEQEVIKAKEVTAAQQRLEVQKIANEEAEQYRQATLKRADADAQARQKMMQADGALDKKLAAYVQVQQAYAEALANIKVPVVPSTVFGGGAQSQSNSVQTFMDLQNMKSARDLGLDVNPGKQ